MLLRTTQTASSFFTSTSSTLRQVPRSTLFSARQFVTIPKRPAKYGLLGHGPIFQTFTRRFYQQQYGQGASIMSAVTVKRVIIGLNIAVFAAWQYGYATQDRKLLHMLGDNFTLSWPNVQGGRTWTILTSAFSHQNLPHILFNMLAFSSFAATMVYFPRGAAHLTAITLGSAVAGSLTYLQNTNDARRALGASGAVAGLIAAVTCVAPTLPVSLLFIPMPVPLWVMTGFFVGLDFYYMKDVNSSIGHAAHLGGGAFGAAYYVLFLRRYGGILGRRK